MNKLLVVIGLLIFYSSILAQDKDIVKQRIIENITFYTIQNSLNKNINTHELNEVKRFLEKMQTCTTSILITDTLEKSLGDYTLYKFSLNLPSVTCNEYGALISADFFNKEMNLGIFGLHENDDKSLLFVSGFLYKNDIRNLFFSKKKQNKIDIVRYISLRYFNYQPINIKIKKVKRRAIFYSEITKKKYVVLFDPNKKEQVKEEGREVRK
jgi:hypothetical protein